MADLQKFNATITNPRTQEYLVSVLAEKKSSFVNNLTALVANNKALQECEPLTTMYAAIKATALNLPLDQNLGFAYVIPFKNNKTGTTEAQFQIGYKGLIQLAMRSGQFKTINVRDVREGEIIDEDFVSGELKFKKLPDAERANAPVIGFVAYFELLNGFRKMSYWTVAELKAHGMRYSQTYSSRNEYVRKNSKWETDFEAMASKTVLKLLLAKYAPLSVEMQDAVVSDQAVFRKSDSDVNYVDNEQEVATKIEAAEEMKALDLSDTSNWTADDFDNAVLKGLMSKEEAQALKQLHSQQEQQTEMFKK